MTGAVLTHRAARSREKAPICTAVALTGCCTVAWAGNSGAAANAAPASTVRTRRETIGRMLDYSIGNPKSSRFDEPGENAEVTTSQRVEGSSGLVRQPACQHAPGEEGRAYALGAQRRRQDCGNDPVGSTKMWSAKKLSLGRNASTASFHPRSGGPQEHQFHGIEHDAQIVELVDERNASLFQWLVDSGVARRTSEEDHAITEVRGAGHQRVVEVEAIELWHDKIAHDGRDPGIGGQGLEGVPAGVGLPYGESPALEDLPKGGPNRPLIVDQEHGRHQLTVSD
jgi:hypothetical protein